MLSLCLCKQQNAPEILGRFAVFLFTCFWQSLLQYDPAAPLLILP